MRGHRAHKTEFLKVTAAGLEEAFASGLADFNINVEYRRDDGAYWRWRYFGVPNPKNSLLVARREGRIVGKVGHIGRRIHSGGKRLTATFMEGLSLPPAERSWSLLTGLLEASARDRRRFSRSFAFGIAGRSEVELFERLGCRILGTLPLLSAVIDGRRFLRTKGVPPPFSLAGWAADAFLGVRYRSASRSISVVPLREAFDGSFDDLWRDAESRRCVAVVKDASYLNWRYRFHPGRGYEILTARRDGKLEGWTVFSTDRKKRGFILELMARDDLTDILRALLQEALIRMRSRGAVVVTASCLDNAPARATFRSAGFRPWPRIASSTRMILETPAQGKSGPEAELSNWDFTLGDWLVV